MSFTLSSALNAIVFLKKQIYKLGESLELTATAREVEGHVGLWSILAAMPLVPLPRARSPINIDSCT